MIIKTNKIREFILWIAIIIVALYILSGPIAFFNGANMGLFGHIEPGLNALVNTYIMEFTLFGMIIPIIPISIIYIIYYIFRKKS